MAFVAFSAQCILEMMQKKVQKSWKVSENWATINQLSWTKCKLSYYVFRYRTDVMLTSSELSFPTFFLHPQKSSPAYHTIFGHFLHRKCNLIEKSNFSSNVAQNGAKFHNLSKKSHVQNHLFQEIHIFKIAFLAKFTF